MSRGRIDDPSVPDFDDVASDDSGSSGSSSGGSSGGGSSRRSSGSRGRIDDPSTPDFDDVGSGPPSEPETTTERTTTDLSGPGIDRPPSPRRAIEIEPDPGPGVGGPGIDRPPSPERTIEIAADPGPGTDGSSAPPSIAGDGPIASADIPGTDRTLGGVLDGGARRFEETVGDAAARGGRELGERGVPGRAGPQGSERAGQLGEDFGRTAAGAFNAPAFGAMGVRLGDTLATQTGRAGVGGPVVFTDGEATEETATAGRAAAREGAEFAQEHPARTGAFVAGGVAGGVGAGLAGRAALQGTRRAGAAARDLSTPDEFVTDTRAMTDGGRTTTRTRTREQEVEVGEIAGPTEAQRRARQVADEFDNPEALAREQARILERDQMPPRDVFEDSAAFESALDQRVARRLDLDVEDMTTTTRQPTRTATQTQTGATAAPTSTTTAGASMFAGTAGLGAAFGFPGVGQQEGEAAAFAEETTREIGLGATSDQIEDTMTETLGGAEIADTRTATETAIGTDTGTMTGMDTGTMTGTATDTMTGTATATRTDTLIGTMSGTDTVSDTATDTQQLFAQPTLAETATTTRPPGGRTRRPPRSPRLDLDSDSDEELLFDEEASDAIFDSGIADVDDLFADSDDSVRL